MAGQWSVVTGHRSLVTGQEGTNVHISKGIIAGVVAVDWMRDLEPAGRFLLSSASPQPSALHSPPDPTHSRQPPASAAVEGKPEQL